MKRAWQKIWQSLGCQGSKRLLLKWIFRWFSLLAEEIGVFPLSLFSLFLAQLIVFICLQNHISASSCLLLRSLACCVLLLLPKTFSSPGSQLADTTVDVGRPILPLQRSDLVSGVQAHLRGERERLYKNLWKEPRHLPCMRPPGPSVLRTKQKASEYYWLNTLKKALLVQVQETDAPLSLSKQALHSFFCLMLSFGFGIIICLVLKPQSLFLPPPPRSPITAM